MIYEIPLQTSLFTETQKKFLESKATYKGFKGGRGSGRNHACLFEILRSVLNSDKDKPFTACVVDGAEEDFCDLLSNEFVRLASAFGLNFKQSVNKVVFDENKKVFFVAANDVGRTRGTNLSLVYLKEAECLNKEAFDSTIACLRENGKQGKMLVSFYENLPDDHWVSQLFASENPQVELFTSPQSTNVFLPSDFGV